MYPLTTIRESEPRTFATRFQDVLGQRLVVSSDTKTPDDIRIIIDRLRTKTDIAGLTLYTTDPLILEKWESSVDPPIPYMVFATPEGQALLDDLEFFTLFERGMDTYHGAERVNSRNSGLGETYRMFHEGECLYVKIDDYSRKFPGASLYEFLGLHLLSERGVHTAPLLLATNRGTVTKEVSGKPLGYGEYGTFNYDIDPGVVTTFRQSVTLVVESLKEEKLWADGPGGFWYDLDLKLPHLFPRDLGSDNPLNWFTVIDGVAADFPFSFM